MPLIKVYNNDSNIYGLNGHSIFKSVCNSEASWRGTFGLPGLSPCPSPGSGGAEFAVFRDFSPCPSPGSGEAELPMVPSTGPNCLSASLC
jgi:hypothetical protein